MLKDTIGTLLKSRLNIVPPRGAAKTGSRRSCPSDQGLGAAGSPASPRPPSRDARLPGLSGALVLNGWLGRAASRAGESAHRSPDLLLSLLPVVDLRVVFVWGFAAFVAWALAVGAWRERHRAAHIVWLYALLIALRSFFIVLTPMRSPAGCLSIDGNPLFDAVGRHLTFRNDLFFSSHTALPFLGFLAYRDRWARLVFFGFSIALAATVLLARQHYSIDVFGAYFITYALYRFERRRLRIPYRRLRARVLGRLLR